MIELGKSGAEGLRNGSANPDEVEKEDKGDWEGEDEFTSKFFTTNIPQFPRKLSPLTLIFGLESKNVTKEPRRSDPTQPKNPSLSSSKKCLRTTSSPLDNEAPSPEHHFRILGDRQKKIGLTLNPRSHWAPAPKASSFGSSSLSDDGFPSKRGSLRLWEPCRQSKLGGNRIVHSFFTYLWLRWSMGHGCLRSLL